jgi:hypothetical protein
LYWTKSSIRVDEYLGGLPECCFAKNEFEVKKETMWSETYKQLDGSVIHAFPRCHVLDVSWARDLTDRQYVLLMSDGDLAMLTSMCRGMGGGNMTICRGERYDRRNWINGCAFHKFKTIKGVVGKLIQAALSVQRAQQNVPNSTKGTSMLINKDSTYDNTFARLIDTCMQTDDAKVGKAAWQMVLRKARLYFDSNDAATKLERYHNPVSGRQGVWGRWNMLQEGAMCAGETVYDAIPHHAVAYGASSTSNAIEGRFNKEIKNGTRMSMAYAPLITKAGKVMTNLGKDLTGVQFSIIEDQLGSCAKTRHDKMSGPIGTQQTGYIFNVSRAILTPPPTTPLISPNLFHSFTFTTRPPPSPIHPKPQ